MSRTVSILSSGGAFAPVSLAEELAIIAECPSFCPLRSCADDVHVGEATEAHSPGSRRARRSEAVEPSFCSETDVQP